MQQIFKNTFEKGLLTDVSDVNQPNGTYTDANAVALYANGNFTSLGNFKGNLQLADIINESNQTEFDKVQVLGVFFLEWYNINTATNTPCLTIFTGTTSNSIRCWVYDIPADTLYSVWAVDFTSTQALSNSSIDLSVYGENGKNVIYFVDNFGLPRKLVCEYPNTTSEELSRLLRPGARGKIKSTTVLNADTTPAITNGRLLSGSYLFTYRAVNLNNNKYTSFSPISSPTYLTGKKISDSSIGAQTDEAIRIVTTLTTLELTEYTHYQLAVIPYTSGETISENAVLLDPIPIDDQLNDQTHDLLDNSFKSAISLTTIVTEQAAIKTAKTILAKDAKLILGNVEYRDLDYDNGDPSIDYANTVEITQAVPADSDEESDYYTKYRGHFRGETYRYYVSYFDEHGNYSRPKVLNFGASGHNDFTFAARSNSNTLLNASSEALQKGLRIIDLVGHPTWAIGFVILRAKRIKNILFQTPVVPSQIIKQSGALGGYPTDDYASTVLEASPAPNQSGTYAPKSYMSPFAEGIYRQADGILNWGAFGTEGGQDKVCVLYGPEAIFTDINGQSIDSGWVGESNLTLNTVDIAFPRSSDSSEGEHESVTRATELGNYATTNISILHEADNKDDYYYRDGDASPAPTVFNPVASVDSLNLIDNNGSQVTFPRVMEGMATNTFGEYSTLQADGFIEGTTGINLRGLVAVLKDGKQDVTRRCMDGVSGIGGVYSDTITQQLVAAAHPFTGISATKFAQGNNILYNNIGFTLGADDTFTFTDPINTAVEIVNVEKGLDSSRYGNPEALHEVVSTGAVYIFNASELSDVQGKVPLPIDIDVWGGDCYVSLFTFKVATNAYSLLGLPSEVSADIITRWGTRSFRETTNEVRRAFPLENTTMTISLYLESEIFGKYTPNKPTQLARSTYDYTYNVGLSKQNDIKAFVPFDTFEKVLTKFKARILYSDTKIYQSDEEGFDRFPVGNFYDMDETYGGLTKIALSGEDVFGIQERGISYIPILRSVIQTADADALSVQSDQFIGKPLYINIFNGSEAIRTINTTPDSVIMFDLNNKQLIELKNKNYTLLSDVGVISLFNTEFDFDDVNDRNLHSYFDVNTGRYVLYNIEDKNRAYVFNRRFGVWETKIDFNTNKPLGGIYGQNKAFTIGEDKANPYKISVFQENAGEYNEFYNELSEPFVKFITNPQPEIAKTYDNVRVYASRALKDVDIKVTPIGDSQDIQRLGMNLDVYPREGYYRIKVLRDDSGQRIRGDKAEYTIRWNENDQNQTFLNSVITKYRSSTRQI